MTDEAAFGIGCGVSMLFGILLGGILADAKGIETGFAVGCKAANPSNSVVVIDGARRCVSDERARDIRK